MRHRIVLIVMTILLVKSTSFSGEGDPTTQTTSGPAAVSRVTKTDDSVLLTFPQGLLRLRVCSDRVIRVTWSREPTIPPGLEFVVVRNWARATFELMETTETVTLATGRMTVQVDRATGRMTYLDKQGNAFLSEALIDARKMTPVTVNGESTFTIEQSFLSPPDEHLNGMTQSQDGIWNWRGIPIELRQLNTQTALPVLVSSKGYGILWNNASLTDFNPADQEVPMTVEEAGSVERGPKATEQLGDPGKNNDRALSVRTGTFTADLEGDYVLFAKGGDRRKQFTIEVDGKTVGGFRNMWVPYTAVAKVRLGAGQKISLRLVGGGGGAELFARPLGDRTTFRSQVGDSIDYFIFYGPTPGDVVAQVRQATGDAPLWPKWALGFWQCRERYSSQDQILETVDEFRQRQIPLDLIIQDWQYWGKHGWGAYEWDESKYPDPKSLIDSLHARSTQFMISVWSNPSGPIHADLAERNLLIGKSWVDAFSPEARRMRWAALDKAFFGLGTDAWWQDATEPGDDGNALAGARSTLGSGDRLRNAYPLFANQAVYEGQRGTTSDKRVVTLTRSSFPGQQRYAAALWSGDIGGNWDALRRQIPAGLHTAFTALPYWTTDCGGFFRPGNQHESPDYNELLVRWFQYSTFCPILRIHGYKSETEMWKFPAAYPHLLRFTHLRYRLLPYNYSLAWQVTRDHATFMRPLPMEFPDDPNARDISDQYMFGPAFLVCPVTTPGAQSRPVYLPGRTTWFNFWTGATESPGQSISAAAPLETLPLYIRAGSIIPLGPKRQYATEKPSDPVELRVYRGADGNFQLYDDEGDGYNYEHGAFATIPIRWNDADGTLTIGRREGTFPGMPNSIKFHIVWVSTGHGVGDTATDRPDETVDYVGDRIVLSRR